MREVYGHDVEEMDKLDAELQHIFNTQGTPKTGTPTRQNIPMIRKFMDVANEKYNASPFAQKVLGPSFVNPTWTETRHDVPVRGGRTIQVRAYVPKSKSTKGHGMIMNLHAGGWFMGSLETDALWCRMLCSKLNVIVVDVAYGLYPDVAFGVPIMDCYDALKWITQHAKELGGDPTKGFIISGNSGGSTYAAAVAHLARDSSLLPPLTGCYMACPILAPARKVDGEMQYLFDMEKDYPSFTKHKDAPLMNDKMRLGIEALADFDFTSPLTTPFLFPSHADLPPTYVAVCGLDPWRDGGLLWSKELEKVGVSTRVECYPGMPHQWWTSYPQVSMTQTWVQNSLEGMKWLLAQKNERSKFAKL